MFSIDYCDFGPFTLVELSNQKTGESFSFIPDFGACMNQLILQAKDGRNYKLLCSNDDYESLITEGKHCFKGSKLFPFPNRINLGCYSFLNHEYRLPANFPSEGHAIHGLLLESCYKIKDVYISSTSGRVTLSYLYNQELDGYPFRFNLEIDFILSDEGFSCMTRVLNLDSCSIPVGDGWHPYFKLGGKIDDLFIKMPVKEEIDLDERRIPNGKVNNFEDFVEFAKIGDRGFDSCFQLLDTNGISDIKVWNKQEDLTMSIWMECGKNKYQYIQIYTPNERDSIAIEPMTCTPDAFNNEKGLIIVPPGEMRSFLWGVRLE